MFPIRSGRWSRAGLCNNLGHNVRIRLVRLRPVIVINLGADTDVQLRDGSGIFPLDARLFRNWVLASMRVFQSPFHDEEPKQ